ncbi:phosphatidate cytidylyltransferase [Podospora aff. communis PSN243]|uniref:dolichol kinase n=1 Tax=Podospora aff. communis PSN243 TaxID=3040156 RepID=A0AAV9GXM3_9PEZI|nr:phosphatidate cytidylyltransferase [Podospora aff. communis PSN243]
MSEHLQPPGASPHPPASDAEDDREQLRILTRSPHPYHRQSSELLEPSDRLVYNGNIGIPAAVSTSLDGSQTPAYLLRVPSFAKDSGPASESGTEADDEHFLKGLPAPKQRLHKGLRGKNEPLSGSSTPILSPAVLEEEGRKTSLGPNQERDKRNIVEKSRRRKELIRRGAEILLLACQGGLIASNRDAQPFIRLYRRELLAFSSVAALLTAVYPLRLLIWAYTRGRPSKTIPIRIPAAFDPAPLLYPSLVPILVSLLVAQGVPSVVPLNIALSLSALPRSLIPGARHSDLFSSMHWLLACVPCFFGGNPKTSNTERQDLSHEVLVLLYPLHQTLCLVLHYLTTTSLLTAELQLLSVGLINILLVGISPQVTILNGVLWGGGLSLLILCSQVIQWGISLARVPKWRFRRAPLQKQGLGSRLRKLVWSLRRSRNDTRSDLRETFSESEHSTDGYPEGLGVPISPTTSTQGQRHLDGVSDGEGAPMSPTSIGEIRFSLEAASPTSSRRHTLPFAGKLTGRAKTTPSGRRKRSASYSVRAFFSLTQSQAAARKWFYAGYVYFCILATIFVGVREHVRQHALSGLEPVGWALGYLFGGIPWFRLEVVKANLENWICLPDRFDAATQTCSAGWVQHLRVVSLGEANTRLVLSVYWVCVIIVGLAVVFSLSPIFEVDTRRKVFHFMMVAMFLPAIFVDPTYIALALSLMLAIFLLLDLLRASQLPPLSKPIASFLTPYVDGRDLRGPVVISHIFLLIGCAIPLWLSLAALPRTGQGYLNGWEVATRDVSMVSGVVCVGLGDAAASLIGRRWGHRKWLWGGGKSIEGSIAFAAAVFVGLMAANAWLRIGGWPMTVPELPARGNISYCQGYYQGIKNLVSLLWSWIWDFTSVQKTALCASVASLTEAVLTGGNDNVVVPVVLWTCVKSMGL